MPSYWMKPIANLHMKYAQQRGKLTEKQDCIEGSQEKVNTRDNRRQNNPMSNSSVIVMGVHTWRLLAKINRKNLYSATD